MILHELQGRETARHKGGRGGEKELTGGGSSCRAAEEMRGPPGGRAQEGRRQPRGEVSGSLPPLEEKRSRFIQGGGRRSYFKNTEVNGPAFTTWISLVTINRDRDRALV
jgi:hypothetical protein